MNKKILIATNNPHKQKMLSAIVNDYFNEIVLLSQLPPIPENDEVGETFKEIAEKKAVHYSKHFDGYVIATDSGMMIQHLENWNPLFTKRFINKEDATDYERMDKLLSLMKNKHGEERRMYWIEAAAIAQNGKVLFSEQVVGAEGLMQETYDPKKYRKGIWLCSLWFFPKFNKNFFDMTEEETSYAEISWVKLKEVTQLFFKEIFKK